MVAPFLVFYSTSILFSIVAVPIYMISLICRIVKTWYKRIYSQNRSRVTDVENKLWLPEGIGWGRDKLRDWD